MSHDQNRINLICLESEAFYNLIDEVVEHIELRLGGKSQERWINDQEAMRILSISSKSTLQKYRDKGLIRFSQPTRKTILYDRESIMEFLDSNARETF